MPAIVTAIVIRWEVEEGQEPTFYDEKSVSMYVGDAEEGSLEVRLIGQYILEEAEEDEDEIGELLEAARDGLLQVTNIEKREVKPPSAPPRHPGMPEEPKRKHQARKRKTNDESENLR
jgi:hypothetical protein